MKSTIAHNSSNDRSPFLHPR